MQITNEQKARIFALYWDSMFRFKVDGQEKISWVHKCTSWDDDCQLLLTPLSKISDEDAIKTATILSSSYYNKNNYKPPIERKGDRVHIWTGGFGVCVVLEDGNINWGDRNRNVTAKISDLLSAYDFLRSKGYALPYMGIDLFASGLAIDKTLNK